MHQDNTSIWGSPNPKMTRSCVRIRKEIESVTKRCNASSNISSYGLDISSITSYYQTMTIEYCTKTPNVFTRPFLHFFRRGFKCPATSIVLAFVNLGYLLREHTVCVSLYHEWCKLRSNEICPWLCCQPQLHGSASANIARLICEAALCRFGDGDETRSM